jgi:hypothetical protein
MHRLLPAMMAAVLTGSALAAEPLSFQLTFDARAHPRPFTGRVYVMLFKADQAELKSWPNWFRPEPCFARDVRDWKPGQPLVIDRTALGYPTTLDRLSRGAYTVQAVMDLHPNDINFSTAAGNLYTVGRKAALDPETSGPRRRPAPSGSTSIASTRADLSARPTVSSWSMSRARC